jgi:hypothetical protein
MSIQFIAVLDHEHLDNSLFLTSFAKSIAALGDRKGLIIHGDSPYTDRLIQTGMMREDARLRAIKDLNKRLIGLFADQGIPTIGIHGFQKNLITKKCQTIEIDKAGLHSLHTVPNLLLSNLVANNGEVDHIPLADFTRMLSAHFDDIDVLLFSKNEKDEILISEAKTEMIWTDLPENFYEEVLPEEFQNFNFPVKITTATELSNWPNLKKVTEIV